MGHQIMKKLIFSFGIVLSITALIIISNKFFSYPKNKVNIKTSDMFEALRFWSEKRAYPQLDIDSKKHYEEFLKTINNETRLRTNYQWLPIGPHNIGGRTLDVKFNPQNPNTIFAASASGGLWISYTGGVGVSAWQRIETGYPVLGIKSIAIMPQDSNTIFIGTGEVYNYGNAIGGRAVRTTRGSYGIGILKTTDYGKTWTKSLDWSYNEERGVNDVEIDPNNFNRIWAATTEGVYLSTNGGNDWNSMLNVTMANDIDIHPDSSNIIFVACGNLGSSEHGIYKSTNFGLSWQKLTQGLPQTFGGKAVLDISKSNPSIIYASIGNGYTSGAGTWLCKSTNGGQSWQVVNNTDYATYQGWYSHYVGIHPQNPEFIICGGIDIWKSTNGGTILTRKSEWSAWYFGETPIGGPEGPPHYAHADHHSIAFHPLNPDTIYFGTDGGVFRSTNGGETFEGLNGGYQTTQFYYGFSSSFTNPNLAIGGMQDNATAIYTGKLNWRRVIGGDGCQTGINQQNNNILYGTYQNLVLLKSTNGGNNWFSIAPPNRSNQAFVAPVIVCISNPDVIYAGSAFLHKSTNAGQSWSLMNAGNMIDGNPIMAIGVSSSSTDTLYLATAPVSTRSKVFRSTNGGVSFTNITGNLPDRYIEDIAVDPNDSKKVYIVLSGFGTSHLYKSTNGGNDWIDIGINLPDVPASAILVNPFNTQQLFFGNDLGVYFSQDGGISWTMVSNGLPYGCIVIDLNFIENGQIIRAITHGNGVYQVGLNDIISNVEKNFMLADYRLYQNYPNPFNSNTKIEFYIKENSDVTLNIFDLTGRLISTIKRNNLSEGKHTISLDFETNVKSKLSSGVYLYILEVKKGNKIIFRDSKKMVYLK